MTAKTRLGVPEMDADHATIERLFERLETTADADLPGLFTAINAEIRAHFAREERLFRTARLPIADCHAMRHAQILADLDAARPLVAAGEPATLRRLVGVTLRGSVADHVDTVDRVTAGLLLGAAAFGVPNPVDA